MKDKEYYINLLETRIIDFNPYWEAPMGKTVLRENTEEAIKMLRSYFNIIKEFERILQPQKDSNPNEEEKFGGDYNSYPQAVKETIQLIIKIINDGRDLWTPTEWKGKTYNHHIQSNGHLDFENNPWFEIRWCESFLDELQEILNSEKSVKDLNKFIDDKWRLFQGYESGAYSVKFKKINKTKDGKYTFDGDMIFWSTPDSFIEGCGVVIYENRKDVPFSLLPYCEGNFKTNEEVDDFIEHHIGSDDVLQTDEEIKKEIYKVMDSYLQDCLNI